MKTDFNFTSKKNNHLQLWARNKNPVCAHIAIYAVASTDDMHNFIACLQQTNFTSQMSKDNIKEWHRLYKDPKRLREYFLSAITPNQAPAFLLKSDLFQLAKTASKANAEQRKRIGKLFENITEERIKEYAKEICSLMPDDIENLISEKHGTNTTPINSASINITEAFIYNNLIRCLIEYTENFFVLYRQARHGNEEAITKLLRLDPIVLEDRFIRNHFTTAMPSVRERFINALNKPLKYHTKPEKIKVTMSGFISAIFEVFGGHPITPQQILDLFTAYAMDVHKKDSDEDLPVELEAFRKAVKRHHQLWKPLISKTHKDLS